MAKYSNTFPGPALLLFAIAFVFYFIGWSGGVTSSIIAGCAFEIAAWIALFSRWGKSDSNHVS